MRKGLKDILVLCDGEEEYAVLMSDFLKMHKELPWEIHTYTAIDTLLEKEKNEEIALLLVAESIFRNEVKTLQVKRLVVLNESGILREEGIQNINKYQQADKVLRMLLEIYADIARHQLPKLLGGCRTKVIGIYSPVRRSCQTTFALTMSQMLAEDKRTLYLNFEHYAGNPGLLLDMQTKDLADLLYFLNGDKDKFTIRMHSMVQQIGRLDYIPPMKAGQNLLNITVGEWMHLLQNLTESEEYEYIILDLSESMQGLFDILRFCTKVFTPVREDAIAKCKLMQYEQMLQLYEYEDVLQKTCKCNFPQITRVPLEIEQYTKSEFAAYVHKQLQQL